MSYSIVFDESGTSNHPGDRAQRTEFACGGLIVPSDKVESLQRVDSDLRHLTGRSDYKFKHVRDTPPARQRFLSGVGASGVHLLGLFAAPGAIALEEDRLEEAATRELGPAPPGMVASPRSVHENMVRVVQYLAGAVFHVMLDQPVYTVVWDRRSDAKRLAQVWQDRTNDHARLLGRATGPGVSFKVQRDHLGLVRLAGVFAGDIVTFFRRVGHRLFPLVRADLGEVRRHQGGFRLLPPRLVAQQRSRLLTPTVDEAPGSGTMLRWYYRRLLNRTLGFFDPAGRSCSVRIDTNTSWSLLQSLD